MKQQANSPDQVHGYPKSRIRLDHGPLCGGVSSRTAAKGSENSLDGLLDGKPAGRAENRVVCLP